MGACGWGGGRREEGTKGEEGCGMQDLENLVVILVVNLVEHCVANDKVYDKDYDKV